MKPVWVRFSDGKVDRKGIIRGFAPRGRGKRAHIVAIVQSKDLFYEVLLARLQEIRTPR